MTDAYRLAAWDTPLWVTPNPAGHRFNQPGDGPTQYLSLHPLTPWAEYLRAEAITSPAELEGLRLRLWALRVDLEGLAEITFSNASGYGIAPADLVGDDPTPCRHLAARLRSEGTPGILVPSAALPGTRNVVLFGPRVLAPYGLEPVDPDIDVPGSHAAEHATTVAPLLEMVRRRGDPHAELAAHRAGTSYFFAEPPLGRWG